MIIDVFCLFMKCNFVRICQSTKYRSIRILEFKLGTNKTLTNFKLSSEFFWLLTNLSHWAIFQELLKGGICEELDSPTRFIKHQKN